MANLLGQLQSDVAALKKQVTQYVVDASGINQAIIGDLSHDQNGNATGLTGFGIAGKTPDGWGSLAPTIGPARGRTASLSGTFGNTVTGTITTSSWAVENGMTVSGNGVKVPITGYYQIVVQATIATISGGGGYIQVMIDVNGTATASGNGTTAVAANANFATATALDEVHCNANDVITAVFTNSAGVSVTLNGGVFLARYTGD